jgi:hypothetical protein
VSHAVASGELPTPRPLRTRARPSHRNMHCHRRRLACCWPRPARAVANAPAAVSRSRCSAAFPMDWSGCCAGRSRTAATALVRRTRNHCSLRARCGSLPQRAGCRREPRIRHAKSRRTTAAQSGEPCAQTPMAAVSIGAVGSWKTLLARSPATR